MLVSLGTIQDTFSLGDNGTIALLPLPTSKNWSLKPGDVVVVRRRDGSELNVPVAGIDLPRAKSAMLGMLFRNVSKSDLPIGAEIWSAGPVSEA